MDDDDKILRIPFRTNRSPAPIPDSKDALTSLICRQKDILRRVESKVLFLPDKGERVRQKISELEAKLAQIPPSKTNHSNEIHSRNSGVSLDERNLAGSRSGLNKLSSPEASVLKIERTESDLDIETERLKTLTVGGDTSVSDGSPRSSVIQSNGPKVPTSKYLQKRMSKVKPISIEEATERFKQQTQDEKAHLETILNRRKHILVKDEMQVKVDSGMLWDWREVALLGDFSEDEDNELSPVEEEVLSDDDYD